jgi:hypothetical protein
MPFNGVVSPFRGFAVSWFRRLRRLAVAQVGTRGVWHLRFRHLRF